MADLLTYALTTISDVKETLGLPSSDNTKNNLITRKINQATEMIERYTGRHFKAQDITEYIDAPGTDQIVLRQRPINSIASIGRRESSQNEDDFDNFNTEDFFFAAGSLDSKAGIIDGTFTIGGGYDHLKVVYNAGYSATNWPTALPADIQEACATLAAFLVDNGTTGTSIKSKTEGQRKIEYFDAQASYNNLFEQLGIDEILDSYANYPLIEGK